MAHRQPQSSESCPTVFLFPQNQDLWIPLTQTADLQARDARKLWFCFRPHGRWSDERECARAELETIGSRLARAYPRTNQGQIPHYRVFPSSSLAQMRRSYTGLYGEQLFAALDRLFQSGESDVGSRDWQIPRDFDQHCPRGQGVGESYGSPNRELDPHHYGRRVMADCQLESTSLRGGGGELHHFECVHWDPLSYTTDYRVFAYFLAIAISAALFFGLAPSLRFSRLDLNAVLKDGGAWRGLAE